jgi:prefoldin subunit 5
MSGNKKEQSKLTFSGSQKASTKPQVKRFQPDTSNNSNNSMDELNNITEQLDSMNKNIAELRGDLKSILKKDEVENLIKTTVTNIVTSLETKLQAHVSTLVNERTKYLDDKIESLEFENNSLKEKLSDLENKTAEKLRDFEEKITKNYNASMEANKRSNYNEQYSRKNNAKILNIPEETRETEESLMTTVTNLIQTKSGVTLKPEDFIAMHRIPTKKGLIRPVLFKLRNNTLKSTLMRKRGAMKAAGHRLVDDVTRLNQGLISRLSMHPEIENAWYFNGSVYGQTKCSERIKFDIYDNINNMISEFRGRKSS